MEAISQGYTPEAQYDAQQAEAALQAEYGGPVGKAIAVAQGGARGLSLGISDAASAALTGALTPEGPQLTPEARERMAALGIEAPEEKGAFATGYDAAREFQDSIRAANPGTAIASEIGGALLPALASGGGSLAAYTPAAAAERLGAAAARGVAGSAPGLARAGLAGAVGGAVEGGLAGLSVGATRLTSEQLANPEEAAEAVISAGAEGLLIGGGLGGLLGAATRGLTGGARRLATAADELGPRAPATEVLPAAPVDLDSMTIALEARPNKSFDIPDPVRGNFAAAMQRQQAAQGGFEQAVQDGTREIRGLFDGVLRNEDTLREFAGIAAKKRANAYNVDHAIPTTEVDELLDGIKGDIATWRQGRDAQGLVSGGGRLALDGLNKALDENRALIHRALARGDVGETYHLLDQGIKGFMGKARNSTKTEPVRDLIEGLYPRIQKFLENEEIWGDMATRQQYVNPAITNRITVGQAADLQQFTKIAGERGVNGWDNIRLANPSAIQNMLSNLGDAGQEGVEEVFRTNLRAIARDATNRATAWGSDALQAKAAEIVTAAKRIEDRLDAVALLRRDAIAGKNQLQSRAVDFLASMVGTVNPAAGWVVSGTARGARGLLTSVAEAGSGIRQRVARSAAALAQGASRGTAVASRAAPVAAASSSGMLAEDEYQGALQEAQELSSMGSPRAQQLIAQAAEMEQHDPELADAYARKVLGRASYIASKLPKMTSAAIFAPKPVLDPVTDRKLRRSVDAAHRPAAALERLAQLAGSPEDIDALKTLYPAMYASFQQQAQQHLQQLEKPLDYQTAVRVALLTGLPTVPGMEPGSLARAQRASASSPAQAEEQRATAQRRGPKFGRDRDNVYAAGVDQVLDRR